LCGWLSACSSPRIVVGKAKKAVESAVIRPWAGLKRTHEKGADDGVDGRGAGKPPLISSHRARGWRRLGLLGAPRLPGMRSAQPGGAPGRVRSMRGGLSRLLGARCRPSKTDAAVAGSESAICRSLHGAGARQAKSAGGQLPSLTGRSGMLRRCTYQHRKCAALSGSEPSSLLRETRLPCGHRGAGAANAFSPIGRL